MPNIKSFGHTASEEMSFEIVDEGRKTDTYKKIKTEHTSVLKYFKPIPSKSAVKEEEEEK